MSEKVRPHHLERKALLYVRQSSAHQVLHNRESSTLQYAMRDRLMALGWSDIEVIDDDLGRSAAGGVQPGHRTAARSSPRQRSEHPTKRATVHLCIHPHAHAAGQGYLDHPVGVFHRTRCSRRRLRDR